MSNVVIESDPRIRLIQEHDLDQVTDTITDAFSTDPTWAPLLVSGFGGLERSRRYWELFVRAACRYPNSYVTADGAAAAVWYPPGAEELSEAEQAAFPDFVLELFGAARAAQLLQTVERFDAQRPAGDYFYLSLLAVQPANQGAGIGMRLLAANLREIDKLGVPTFLESSNPKNDEKYRRLGFQPHGSIELPSGLVLTTFWREPVTAH